MRKIVLITSFDRYYEMYSLLTLSDTNWDIVGTYMNIPSEVYDAKTNLVLKPFKDISEIPGLFSEFVLVEDVFWDLFYNTLTKFIEKENILLMKDLWSKYAVSIKPMDVLRKKVEIVYPRDKVEGRNVTIGDFTYDPPHVYNGSDKYHCKVGKFCSIAKDVEVYLYMEHRSDWNTTYPFNVLMSDFAWIEGNPASKGDVVIGNDVWIGDKTIIMSGVEIGDGCVIGAHSTVTKSIPPYSVALGSPAKVLKPRFSQEIIDRFMEMEWWNWEDDLIYEAIPLLQSQKYDELYDFYLKKVKK